MGSREGLSRQLDASPQAQGREFKRLCEKLLENDAMHARGTRMCSAGPYRPSSAGSVADSTEET
jgi:hypothetical protein